MKTATEASQKSLQTERRRYTRVPKQTTVTMGKVTYPMDDAAFVKGKTENISLGGVKMNLPSRFEEGTLVQMKITLPGWQRHHPGFIKVLENSIGSPLTAIGEVMRADKSANGYAVAARFVNIDPDDFVALQKYLEKQTN